jgi:uncharacterized protein YjbK
LDETEEVCKSLNGTWKILKKEQNYNLTLKDKFKIGDYEFELKEVSKKNSQALFKEADQRQKKRASNLA